MKSPAEIIEEHQRLAAVSARLLSAMPDLRGTELNEAALANKLNCAKMEALAWVLGSHNHE